MQQSDSLADGRAKPAARPGGRVQPPNRLPSQRVPLRSGRAEPPPCRRTSFSRFSAFPCARSGRRRRGRRRRRIRRVGGVQAVRCTEPSAGTRQQTNERWAAAGRRSPFRDVLQGRRQKGGAGGRSMLLTGPSLVHRPTLTAVQAHSKRVLPIGVPLEGRQFVPPHRLHRVLTSTIRGD